MPVNLPHYHYYSFFDEPSGEYVAECREIPGLSGIGESAPEALMELKDAITGWLEVIQEDGLPVPEPEYSNEIASQQYEFFFRSSEKEVRCVSDAEDLLWPSGPTLFPTLMGMHDMVQWSATPCPSAIEAENSTYTVKLAA